MRAKNLLMVIASAHLIMATSVPVRPFETSGDCWDSVCDDLALPLLLLQYCIELVGHLLTVRKCPGSG